MSGPRFTRIRVRTLAVTAVAAAGALAMSLVPVASAIETPAPEGALSFVSPSTVRAGDPIKVSTSGWAPGTQLQAVVCGDAGISGSNACDLPAATTGMSDAKGRAEHNLIVGKPKADCPCVVRISTFSAPALAMNVPFELKGHPIGTPPVPVEASSDLRIGEVELQGRGGLRALLGLGGTSALRITVANRGEVASEVPDIAYGFGRPQVELTETLSRELLVPAKSERVLEVPVDVPLLAFGGHEGSAQWADGTGSVESGRMVLIPIGAIVALLALLLLTVIGDLRRSRERRGEDEFVTLGAHRFLGDQEEDAYPLPDMVYVEDLGGYLVKPSVLRHSRLTKRLTGRVSTADLAKLAADGGAVAEYEDGTRAATPSSGAGGMLATLLRSERHRHNDRGDGSSLGSGPGLRFFVRPERGNDSPRRADRSSGSGSGLSFFVRPDRDSDV